MTWHSAFLAPLARSLTTSGRSAKGDEPVRKASKTGSARSWTARSKSVRVGAAMAARPCDDANLAGADREAPGVEILAEWQGDFPVGVPGHFNDVALVTNQLQASLQAFLGRGAVEDDVAVSQGVIGVREVDTKCVGELLAVRIDVDQLQPPQRERPQQRSHHAAHQPCAHNRHAVAQPGAGFPECVHRCFDSSREHCTPGRHVSGNPGQRADRHDVTVLVRVQAENPLSQPGFGAVLHHSHRQVAEFHRPGEVPLLVRCTHLFGHPRRHRAAVHHHLRALADAGIERPDQRLRRGPARTIPRSAVRRVRARWSSTRWLGCDSGN